MCGCVLLSVSVWSLVLSVMCVVNVGIVVLLDLGIVMWRCCCSSVR